jgi:hypothetical protein
MDTIYSVSGGMEFGDVVKLFLELEHRKEFNIVFYTKNKEGTIMQTYSDKIRLTITNKYIFLDYPTLPYPFATWVIDKNLNTNDLSGQISFQSGKSMDETKLQYLDVLGYIADNYDVQKRFHPDTCNLTKVELLVPHQALVKRAK